MSKAKRTTKTAKPSADATVTSPPDKPETFETRRKLLFMGIIQQLAGRGFESSIERDKDCIAEYYQLHLTRNGYNVSLRFKCDSHYTASASWRLGKSTGWPELWTDCVSPSVTYKPKGQWSGGTYNVTQGVNVEKIVERFEIAFEQCRAKDEQERDRNAKLVCLLAEARRINGVVGRDIVGVVDGDPPDMIIRLCNYRDMQMETMARALATDAMLPIVQGSGDSLDRLDREIQSTRRRLAERFAK